MNIYQYFLNNYKFLFKELSNQNEDNLEQQLKRFINFCFLDNKQQYACGCVINYYHNDFQLINSTFTEDLYEFNIPIDINKTIPNDFKIIDKRSFTEHVHFNDSPLNKQGLKELKKLKDKYIDKSFTLDCIVNWYTSKRDYTITNNNQINLTVGN